MVVVVVVREEIAQSCTVGCSITNTYKSSQSSSSSTSPTMLECLFFHVRRYRGITIMHTIIFLFPFQRHLPNKVHVFLLLGILLLSHTQITVFYMYTYTYLSLVSLKELYGSYSSN